MASPLTDPLSDEALAWLAVKFAELKQQYPPVRFEQVYGHTFMRPILGKRPWQL